MHKRAVFCILLLVTLFLAPERGHSQDQTRSSNPARVRDGSILTITAGGGVEFDHAQNVFAIDRKAGEEICFTLTAKDRYGKVIPDWNRSGSPTTIILTSSSANTDSSARSWNADSDGYTWTRLTQEGAPLTMTGPYHWSLPNTVFDTNGQTRICFSQSKAERGVMLVLAPLYAGLYQQSDLMNFIENDPSNFMIELISHVPAKSAVYHLRTYEITVTPRDRFMNTIKAEMNVRFSARWSGEFNDTIPGLDSIFSGDVRIKGRTPFLVASGVIRELPADGPQHIIAYASADTSIIGRSVEYEILSHEPVDFDLLAPVDRAVVTLITTAGNTLDFTWTKPQPADPYFQIKTSTRSSAVFSDTVRYTVVFTDSLSLTRSIRFPSNNSGTEANLTFSHQQLFDLRSAISGVPTTCNYTLIWQVEATDGLYLTRSRPRSDTVLRSGHLITLITNSISDDVHRVNAPAQLALGQNFPNPFNPSTCIHYSIPKSGAVSLRVYDLLGTLMRTLVDEQCEGGEYIVDFDTADLPSGTYIYKLDFDGATLTRRMTLMK